MIYFQLFTTFRYKSLKNSDGRETIKRSQEGRSEGLAAGAAEKALSDARNFLAEGIPPETVARCIGLPVEEVKALQKKV